MAKPAKIESVRILVSSAPGNVADTASKLRAHGMKVDSVLEGIGVITGEIEAGKLGKLKTIAGITVEPEETVQLPPPNAPIQ